MRRLLASPAAVLAIDVHCAGLGASRHAIVVTDGAGERRIAEVSAPDKDDWHGRVEDATFPLRVVVTGATCSYATTVTTPTDHVRVGDPVDCPSTWDAAPHGVDAALDKAWSRCEHDPGFQAALDAAPRDAPIRGWRPFYSHHRDARLELLRERVNLRPDPEIDSLLVALVEEDGRFGVIVPRCTCAEPKPTMEVAGALLLRGIEGRVVERREAPEVVVCACTGEVLWSSQGSR